MLGSDDHGRESNVSFDVSCVVCRASCAVRRGVDRGPSDDGQLQLLLPQGTVISPLVFSLCRGYA